MPSPDRECAPAEVWLSRAKSNLELARLHPAHGVWLEDLCFNAQQAAEKALKAVLIHRKLPFRYVHDLQELMTTLLQSGVQIPEDVQTSAILTHYAVAARYPGDDEPVTEDEYREAVRLAESVVSWADKICAN